MTALGLAIAILVLVVRPWQLAVDDDAVVPAG